MKKLRLKAMQSLRVTALRRDFHVFVSQAQAILLKFLSLISFSFSKMGLIIMY